MLGFYHLITHAVFKFLLFLYAGNIIHLMKNNQNIQCLRKTILLVSTVFYVSILSTIECLLAGFYSKDLIIEFLYISEIKGFLMFIILRSNQVSL